MAADTDSTLDVLTLDPRTARTHGERNLGLIADTLREAGTACSLVVDETGTILAGDATVAAATQVGPSQVRVVDADGSGLIAVRRSELSPDWKTWLALYDPRTAEPAEWDTNVLASLADEVDVSLLRSEDELADLLGQEPEPVTLLGDSDEVPDLLAEPVTRPSDLWMLGSADNRGPP